jgi:hypothetical protein
MAERLSFKQCRVVLKRNWKYETVKRYNDRMAE